MNKNAISALSNVIVHIPFIATRDNLNKKVTCTIISAMNGALIREAIGDSSNIADITHTVGKDYAFYCGILGGMYGVLSNGITGAVVGTAVGAAAGYIYGAIDSYYLAVVDQLIMQPLLSDDAPSHNFHW